MKQAYGRGNRIYSSYKELLENESNGYVVSVLFRKKNLANVSTIGPFDSKREAKNKAQVIRRAFNNTPEMDRNADSMSLYVRPLWKPRVL